MKYGTKQWLKRFFSKRNPKVKFIMKQGGKKNDTTRV